VRFGNDRSPLPEYYFIVSRLGAAVLRQSPLFTLAQSHAGATHRKQIPHPGETNSVLDPCGAVKNSR
jgi:hypothetical protein